MLQVSMMSETMGQLMEVWPAVSGFIFVPHNEAEYNQAVAFLDELTDIVKEDEPIPWRR
jgi:hypothetical protein